MRTWHQANPDKKLDRTSAKSHWILAKPAILTIGLSVLLLLSAGCAFFAVSFAPPKTAKLSEGELAEKAKATFWNNFHGGRYDQLPETFYFLTAAYLENPRDPEISLLLAHSHLWKIAERSRQPNQDPTITDHIILAERYFSEAHRLNPEDHRIPGWLGGAKLALGSIHQDERLTREGYFILQDAIGLFPEFNYFSAGYVMSGRPSDNERFKEGLEYMWKTLDLCTGQKIDRVNPDYSRFMALEVSTGPKRVCWNSSIAPHNFEGFFLNMGDMVVKNGEAEVAKKVYQIAKLSKDYESWKYRPVLEERIAKAEERSSLFKDNDPKNDPEIMFGSSYACMACHAR